MIQRRIVAEINCNWPRELDTALISQKFELAIKKNADRGFALESWHMTTTLIPETTGYRQGMNETIIAVFVEV